MGLGCPLLRGSSDRRLRRCAATVIYSPLLNSFLACHVWLRVSSQWFPLSDVSVLQLLIVISFSFCFCKCLIPLLADDRETHYGGRGGRWGWITPKCKAAQQRSRICITVRYFWNVTFIRLHINERYSIFFREKLPTKIFEIYS